MIKKFITLFALLLFATAIFAVPARVQIVHKQAGTAANAVTIASTGAGNVLIVAVAWDGTATLTCSTGVVDTHADTFANAVAPTTWKSTTTLEHSAICYAKNIAAANTTVTVTLSAGPSNQQDVYVDEASGLLTTTPLDQTAQGATAGCPSSCGAATSISSGATSTTTSANEYLFCAVVNNDNSGTWSSPTGGFSIISQVALSAALDQVVSSTGAYTCGVSGTSAAMNAQLATFAGPGSAVTRRRAEVLSK